MNRLVQAVLAVSVAVTWAGAAAPAWPAAAGMATGARPPGAGYSSAAGVARPAGSWGRAIEVPGLGALDKGRRAAVSSVSCASAGSCAAGGYYSSGHQQGFVVSERRGRWGKAIEVPGLEALTKGRFARVLSVSCASAGNCAAGGYYYAGHNEYQGFVVSERHGRWSKAVEVPGLEALNKGGDTRISVSCASAGNCAAGGFYAMRHGYQGFVVSEKNGVWGRAIVVPGLETLNAGSDAGVESVSCASPGNCAAGGNYADRRDNAQGFVAVERHGRWGRAIGVPGLGTLNADGFADVISVSCATTGSCAAGGQYNDGLRKSQGFVAVEKNGVWGRAIEVPGLGALNAGSAGVLSVSCGSAGNCAAGGDYRDGDGSRQGFVAVEKNGVWGHAIEVPHLGALNVRGAAEVTSVSCGSAGNCAAGGDYQTPDGSQGFVAVEKNGVWGHAIEVPGLEALDRGGEALLNSVSCAPAGTCVAGGSSSHAFGHSQGFVVRHTG